MSNKASKDDARKIEIAELSAMMSNSSGRNCVRRILVSSGYFADTYDPDPIKSAYKAGGRAVGLRLAAELQEVCPELWIILLREHYGR